MTRTAFLGLFAVLAVGALWVASADEEAGRRPTWEQTIQAIAESEKYGGLQIVEQKGLVPLGPDPASGLQEFAVEKTGAVPKRDPKTRRLVLTDDFAIVLVLIPGGTFWMGAQRDDEAKPNYYPHALLDEAPVHKVNLSPFFLGKYECTQAQWGALSGGKTPSKFGEGEKAPRRPVEVVSWNDCTRVLGARGLALTTEAQWEYACRVGTTTPWWTGADEKDLDRAAWTDEFRGGAPHPVGEKAPNAFGLHDVHGNVWEWCQDAYGKYPDQAVTDPLQEEGSGERVHRGGSWFLPARIARSAYRNRFDPGLRYDDLGCRPARPCVTTD